MKTLNPETQLIGSRDDGDAFVYIFAHGSRPVEVRVPKAAFNGLPDGALGVQPRRAVLARHIQAAVLKP